MTGMRKKMHPKQVKIKLKINRKQFIVKPKGLNFKIAGNQSDSPQMLSYPLSHINDNR